MVTAAFYTPSMAFISQFCSSPYFNPQCRCSNNIHTIANITHKGNKDSHCLRMC